MELLRVEHLGKSRFRILRGLGLAYRFICARRRLGRNGTSRRGPTKRCCIWPVERYVGRPERDRKRFQSSPDTAPPHNRPGGSADQAITKRNRASNPTGETNTPQPPVRTLESPC